MQVTPKTEAEVSQFSVFPSGVYDFEIIDAKDKKSKAGNDMIELKLKVFDAEGKTTNIFDYLLDAMAFKLRHCCVACGLEEKYLAGTIEASDFPGCSGQVKIGVDVPVGYPEKNVVKDYVVKRSEEEKERTAKNHGLKKGGASELDDSIPF